MSALQDPTTDIVRTKLSYLTRDDILFDDHAYLRSFQRQIPLHLITTTLLNPRTLLFARQIGSKKYDCYFTADTSRAQRYILFLTARKCIVRSVMYINKGFLKKLGVDDLP